MNNIEICRELEILSSEFKVKVLEHFKNNDFKVQLKNSVFFIEQKNEHVEFLDIRDTHTLSCHFNSQGQVVCT